MTKADDDDVEWRVLKPEIFATLMDFFASGTMEKTFLTLPHLYLLEGLPVVNEDVQTSTDTEILEDDDDTVAMIKELLDTRYHPT